MSRFNLQKFALRGRAQESKYSNGVVLPNGERTAVVTQDDLARCANQEMRLWLRTLPQHQRDAVRFACHIPVNIAGAE